MWHYNPVRGWLKSLDEGVKFQLEYTGETTYIRMYAWNGEGWVQDDTASQSTDSDQMATHLGNLAAKHNALDVYTA